MDASVKEILSRFHVDGDLREHMKGPFFYDGYTYATDGASIVRVEWKHADEKKELGKKLISVIPFGKTGFPANVPIVEIKKIAKNSRCEHCCFNPKVKKVRTECPECGGDCFVSFGNDYNNYECECQSCDGYGYTESGGVKYHTPECPECGGTGIKSTIPIRIDGTKFNAALVHRVVDFENVGFGIVDTKAGEALRFHNEIFEGFIMSMRE